MAQTLRASAHGFTFGDRVAALWTSVKAAHARRKVYRQTYAELAGLSDKELADLGLHRSGIRRIALEHAYGL
ncbi:DUF1127 domain-containing protein [Seohaeicola zhoushanensis]|uniref:YjiS-like domain-containing protein n=1 Tax=Seohaeicola zhoushanensis TaxID=1569283 RepID=A0A8J3M5P0_9RHOB|nr:DUF1127 domain-containing protein [Seohaeicola zhoushanensis]GHF43542.1 hypothetical protein GCM10017056_14300 [Seohaeicola zhoushanensis]